MGFFLQRALASADAPGSSPRAELEPGPAGISWQGAQSPRSRCASRRHAPACPRSPSCRSRLAFPAESCFVGVWEASVLPPQRRADSLRGCGAFLPSHVHRRVWGTTDWVCGGTEGQVLPLDSGFCHVDLDFAGGSSPVFWL